MRRAGRVIIGHGTACGTVRVVRGMRVTGIHDNNVASPFRCPAITAAGSAGRACTDGLVLVGDALSRILEGFIRKLVRFRSELDPGVDLRSALRLLEGFFS